MCVSSSGRVLLVVVDGCLCFCLLQVAFVAGVADDRGYGWNIAKVREGGELTSCLAWSSLVYGRLGW